MIPTEQTILHDPDLGLVGNCFQAILAALLHLPIDNVPHFCKLYPARWRKKLNEWLRPFGLAYLEIGGDVAQTFADFGITECFHEIAGDSPRFPSVLHSCVGKDGAWIFDPHPDKQGIERAEAIGIFIVLEPWKFVGERQ